MFNVQSHNYTFIIQLFRPWSKIVHLEISWFDLTKRVHIFLSHEILLFMRIRILCGLKVQFSHYSWTSVFQFICFNFRISKVDIYREYTWSYSWDFSICEYSHWVSFKCLICLSKSAKLWASGRCFRTGIQITLRELCRETSTTYAKHLGLAAPILKE